MLQEEKEPIFKWWGDNWQCYRLKSLPQILRDIHEDAEVRKFIAGLDPNTRVGHLYLAMDYFVGKWKMHHADRKSRSDNYESTFLSVTFLAKEIRELCSKGCPPEEFEEGVAFQFVTDEGRYADMIYCLTLRMGDSGALVSLLNKNINSREID